MQRQRARRATTHHIFAIALQFTSSPTRRHNSSQFHAAMEASKRGGAGGGDSDALAEATDAVLHSKIARGALTSILGPGFVGGVPRGGGGSSSFRWHSAGTPSDLVVS